MTKTNYNILKEFIHSYGLCRGIACADCYFYREAPERNACHHIDISEAAKQIIREYKLKRILNENINSNR